MFNGAIVGSRNKAVNRYLATSGTTPQDEGEEGTGEEREPELEMQHRLT